MLGRIVSEMHRRVRNVIAGAGDVSERPLRNTGERLGRIADDKADIDQRIGQDFPGPEGAGPGSGGAESAGDLDAPLVVADTLHRIHLSGAQAMWANFLPRFWPYRSFERWALAKTEGPLPRLGPRSAMNCREMIMWAAAESKVLTHAQIRAHYRSISGRRAQRARQRGFLPHDFPQQMQQATLPHGTRDLVMAEPDGARPERGDLIMWDGWGEGNAHTAMATGRLIGPDRDPEVYSFWPPPKGRDIPGAVTDAVQITTVGALTPFVSGPDSPALPIRYGRGPW
ncbi:hypothetical protein [Nocardia sp. NPDC003963]